VNFARQENEGVLRKKKHLRYIQIYNAFARIKSNYMHSKPCIVMHK